MKSIILAVVIAITGVSAFVMFASMQAQAENVRSGDRGGGG